MPGKIKKRAEKHEEKIKKTATPKVGKKTATPKRKLVPQTENEDFILPVSTEPVMYWAGIGASAGGLEALREVLKFLPKEADDAGITYIVAQHLSPKHQSMLVQLLGRETDMRVEEIQNNIVPEPGVIYITPPNSNVYVKNGALFLSTPTAENSPKPSVDYFFKTLADELENLAIAVILSGTGSDGSHGIKAICSKGGLTIAQDPKEAKYAGMPGNAIATGCVDFTLPARSIGPKILSIIHTAAESPIPQEDSLRVTLHELLHLLKKHSNVDFKDYKTGTLFRRINRRMLACGVKTMEEYLAYAQDRPEELELLFRDIMITVTHFFRDKEAFDSLKLVVKRLLDDKGEGRDIRIWVPGCATGEEAYSIIILFAEIAGGLSQLQQRYNFQLFATDIDPEALSVGRKGAYAEATFEDMDIGLRERYFRRQEDGNYEVIRPLKDLVMFSKHNVFEDPPFLRIDMISCRNLLIYFNNHLQTKVMGLFHYALNMNGVLFLGKSEALGHSSSLFQTVDNKAKIYRHKIVSSYDSAIPVKPSYSTISKFEPASAAPVKTKTRHDFPDAIVAALAPNSLLIDENMNVLRVYGNVQAYIQISAGEVSTKLVSLIRNDIRQELQAMVYKVLRERDSEASLTKKITIEGNVCQAKIAIKPLILQSSSERLLLISFSQSQSQGKAAVNVQKHKEDPFYVELEQELAATREYLQTVVEELEASNEELQSTKEEMQSTNEELQSSNEELETANEELQSTNEELLTVNDELQIKTLELSNINEDLENIKESIDQPILVVDKKLQITRFNKAAYRIFLLSEENKREALTNVGTKIDIPNIRKNVLQVISTGKPFSRQLNDEDACYYERVLPYMDSTGAVNGAVLTYIDNTQEQATLSQLKQSQERYRLATEGANAGMWDWDIVNDKMHWSELLQRMLGIRRMNIKPSFDELKKRIHLDDRDDVVDILKAHLDRGFDFNVEFRIRKENGTYFWAHASGQAMWDNKRNPIRMTGFIYDVTERREALEHLSKTNESLERFAYVCSHDLKEPARSIENFAFLIADSFKDILGDEGMEYVKYIQGNAARMQEMIKGILSYSQLDSKDLLLENINMEEELVKVLENLKLSIQESKAMITNSPLPTVGADKLQMFQILQNLIGNAIKFRKPGDVPHVHISVEENGDHWVFSVKDNGIGMRPEQTHKIFNVFQRLNKREEYAGTGIGLSICQKLVQKHKGKIWVESEPGKGSTFYFSLPKYKVRKKDDAKQFKKVS